MTRLCWVCWVISACVDWLVFMFGRRKKKTRVNLRIHFKSRVIPCTVRTHYNGRKWIQEHRGYILLPLPFMLAHSNLIDCTREVDRGNIFFIFLGKRILFQIWLITATLFFTKHTLFAQMCSFWVSKLLIPVNCFIFNLKISSIFWNKLILIILVRLC